MPRTGYALPSAYDTPTGTARVGRRRIPTTHAEGGMRTVSVGLAGILAIVLALVPLAGWGAGWAPLASFAPGWPVVPPLTALALAIAAVGTAVHGTSASRRTRRSISASCGALLLLAVAALAIGGTPLPAGDAAALVERWPTDPLALLQLRPSVFTLGALAFLGAALALLGTDASAAVRGAWILAVGAALVALLTAGPPNPELGEEAARPLLAPRSGVETTPPPVAFVLLLLASAILLVPARDGSWWVPGRRSTAALVRLLLPGLLLVAPGLVWLEELLERRQLVPADLGLSLLATGLVVGLALLLLVAVWRLGRSDAAERERDQRRLKRQLEAESEHAAQRADQTLRVATDRYRTHLRSILDVAPAPFVAVDRDGHVAYLNGAAVELFGCRPGEAAGRPLWEVWPELGAELRGALGSTVGGAAIRQTLVSRRTGRTVELRGYPDEAGSALFLREVGRGAG
jgi:PAS domain S-box-containing protein